MTLPFDALAPTPAQIGGVAAILAVAACFALIGRTLASRQGDGDGALLIGWAVVSALFTIAGALRLASFTVIAVLALLLALGAAIALILRRRQLFDPPLLRIVAIALPLIAVMGSMAPSQWDEFSNWLPNVRYLVEHDAFPGVGLPKNPSVFPAYPYGLPLVAYLASRIAGHLVENGIALFNLLLLLSFGLLLARTIRGTLASPAPDARLPRGLAAPEDGRLGWGWCAFAALLVTALNPTFVPKVVFTAYADTGTAVALGFGAAFAWHLLNALAEGSDSKARAAALRLGLAATALVATKQVNAVLALSLVLTIVIGALRDPAIAARSLLRCALPALAPPLALYIAWRLYVAFNIVGGEFSIRPPEEWALSLIPEVIGGMISVASKKGGYFGLMLVALACGARALWRPSGSFSRLSLIAAGLFVAYNGFLFFAYIAAFGTDEGQHVASYWRYNMHLGCVALLFGAYGGALLWRRHIVPRWRPHLAWLAILLAVAAPLALAGKLRFDLNPRYLYARATADDIAAMLTPADRLMLIDLEDDGQYLVIMRYAMHGSATVGGEISAQSSARSADRLREVITEIVPTHLWIYRPLPVLESVIGRTLERGSSYLLKREAEGWVVLRAWPHPQSAQ